MLNMSKILRNKKNLLLSLALFGIVSSHQTHASCQSPESLFEQKDCEYQAYIKLQSELDSVHRLFIEKFTAQVKENGGDTKAAKAKLAQAHAAWKKYVHTDCELSLLLNSGNSAGQNQLACEAGHIRQQIKVIKEYQF